MSGVLKVIGTIAAVVAVVAGSLVTFGAVGGAVAATLATVASVASLVALGANIGAALLTGPPKPPPARGSVTSLLISPDAPSAYVMGEGVFAGALRHDTAYGGMVGEVPNPYRFLAIAYCVAGPVEDITPWVDLAPVDSWYAGFLWTDVQLGARPEADALVPNFAGAPGWGSDYKLSSKAAIGWSLLFDKDGKRFASGTPKLGAYGKWVKVYDPRLDSTFPGGSGSHRINDETTWEWSENPALHAISYSYGRRVGDTLVMGVGLPADGIDLVMAAAWANICDANAWRLFGVITEPGDRWANLKDICAAGGAEPIFAGGLLSFKYAAPKVTLDTITEADLADEPFSVTAMASWRDRVNTIVPKYRSPDHDWELVDADPVSVGAYVTEDGEEKRVEWPFNFVKDVDQAAELAAYRLMDSRELQPITLTCGPRLRAYRPGECLQLDIPQLGLDTPAVILKRDFDPGKMTVALTLMGETPTKHDYALGLTGTAPATPALGMTPQERDETASGSVMPAGLASTLIQGSYCNDADPVDGLLQATDTVITIEAHSRVYSDKAVSVSGATRNTEADGTTALVAATLYHVYYDDNSRAGGSVSYKVTQSASDAANSPSHPYRHYVGSIMTDVVGGTGTSAGGSVPIGWDPGAWYY